MRKLILLLTVAVFCAVGVGIFVIGDVNRTATESASSWPLGSTGSDEDPDARANWELMRLADPRTGRIPEGIRQRELAYAKTLPVRNSFGKVAALTWEQRGPVNIGGRTRALAIDATNENILLAGGVSGGMYRSTDGGTTWAKTFTPSQLHSVTAIAQDTRTGETSTWYVGTGEFTLNTTGVRGGQLQGDGIYKSTDGGLTWSLLASTSDDIPHVFNQQFDFVWDIAIDPSNTTQDEVYAAIYGDIVRSTDGGVTWFIVRGEDNESSPFAWHTDVAVTSTGVVYASLSDPDPTQPNPQDRGLWRSLDGLNWTEITPGTWPAGDYQRTEISISPANENLVWFLGYSPGNGTLAHQLWQYNAGTALWTDYTAWLPARGGDVGDFNSQSGYDLTVKAHPTDTDIVFVGGTSLFRIDVSLAAGSADTWIGGHAPANDGSIYANHHNDIHALAFRPSNASVMYSGTDGGVHRTDNNLAAGDGGVTWVDLNTGYYTTQFYSVCLDADAGDSFVGGGMQDNGSWGTVSTSPAVVWDQEAGGDGGPCQVVDGTTTDQIRYVSANFGAIKRNAYTGGVISSSTNIHPSAASGQAFVNPFVTDPSDDQIIYYAAGPFPKFTIWRTTTAETATQTSGWTNLTPTVPQASTGQITAMGASEYNDPHVLYFGTSIGELYRVDNANTVTAGFSPVNVFAGTPFEADSSFVSDIAVDPFDSDRVLLTLSNYNVVSVFLTEDGGTTWTNVEGNLKGDQDPPLSGFFDGPTVRSAAFMPGSTTPYLVGTSVGVYSATALSTSTVWAQEGATEIGNVVVEAVRGRRSDGLVAVATHAIGVYTSTNPLAVEMESPLATVADDRIVVTWRTLSETNNVGFDIEVRNDSERAAEFEVAGHVPGAGSSAEPVAYQYAVTAEPGDYTLRLKQIDLDGAFRYSESIEVSVEIPGGYVLSPAYPNPFADVAQFDLLVREEQNVRVELFDVSGRLVRVIHDGMVPARTKQSFVLDGNGLASGLYLYHVVGERFATTESITVMR